MTVKIDDVVVWVQGEVLSTDTVANGGAHSLKRCSVIDGEVSLDVEPGTYTVVATATVTKP